MNRRNSRLRNALVALLILTVLPTLASAQATTVSKLAFDQPAPTLADVQGYTFKYYADGSVTSVVLPSVTCTGTTSPFQCEASFPRSRPAITR